MKKYVVALKGENRLEYFFNAPGSADFDIFWGIDGRALPTPGESPEFDAVYFEKRKGRLARPGEVGCALSHTYVWRDFLESGEEWALVAEDDALIHPSIDEIVSRVIEKSRSIGVVNFADGWSTQMGRMNTRTPYPRLSLFSPFIWGRHRLGYCAGDWTACTGLYLISRSAAQKIIEQIDAHGSQYWLADDWPLFAADFGVDIKVMQPGLCGWTGNSLIEEDGTHFVYRKAHQAKNQPLLNKLRIYAAPKARLKNAQNIVKSTLWQIRKKRRVLK